MIHPSAFRLATHANAALAGLDVDWNRLPEFPSDADWTFYVPGSNGRKLRKTPAEWVETMRSLGTRRAWYGYGPPDAPGDGVWTESDAGRNYYHATETFEERILVRASLNGRPVSPSFAALFTEVQPATEALRNALPWMLDYASGFNHNEFVPYFTSAMDLFAGRATPPEWVDSMFPSIYPQEHRILLAAAAAGNVFGNGGMGWWNDFNPRDPELFRQLTECYRGVLFSAYVAASRLEIIIK